jgi:hypothetical protein
MGFDPLADLQILAAAHTSARNTPYLPKRSASY